VRPRARDVARWHRACAASHGRRRRIPAAEPTTSGEPRAKILVVDARRVPRDRDGPSSARKGRICRQPTEASVRDRHSARRPELFSFMLTDLLMREDGRRRCAPPDPTTTPTAPGERWSCVTSANSARGATSAAVRAGADAWLSKRLCRVSLLPGGARASCDSKKRAQPRARSPSRPRCA